MAAMIIAATAVSFSAGGSSKADDVFGGDSAGVAHVYKKIGDRELRLFVVSPAEESGRERRPAILFFHGGAWTSGRPVQFNEHCRYLATRGLVCAQVEYRLLASRSNDPPLVCVQDAKSAVRWVRAHASELRVDEHRIAAAGGSAGGHLAAVCGMIQGLDDPLDDPDTSARANALVLFNPVFDNGPDRGWGHERVGTRFREFSPAHNISPDDPPTIVFVGTQDKLVPLATVNRFKANMTKAGVRCEVITYEGQGHGFFNAALGGRRYVAETLIATDRFLESLGWVRGPPTLATEHR